MSKKIVSFELPDGTFPTVGMNHRYITSLKSRRGIRREALRSCHAKPNRKFQVTDFYTDRILFEESCPPNPV